jgi:hypothetical protein
MAVLTLCVLSPSPFAHSGGGGYNPVDSNFVPEEVFNL